jgi:hypothetical protein
MRDHRPQVCLVPSAPRCRMYARWCAWWCPERVPAPSMLRLNYDAGEVRWKKQQAR